MLNSIIEAIQVNEAAGARAGVQAVIRTLESMPLAKEGYPPVPGLIGQRL